MKIRNIFKHSALVIRHKHRVFLNCAKCGILWRGIVHDLSKFNPVEFFESAKYFNGHRSPIALCRMDKGVSRAWLHHKGRNKHHIEYWLDGDCEITPLMPYKYAVECFCDKVAATKVYAKKSYTQAMPLDHWLRVGCRVNGNPRTMAFLEKAFRDLAERGEKYVMNKKYMKKTYSEICLNG